MKNTLLFLMASLLLAFSLTACGGGRTGSAPEDYGDSSVSGDGAYDGGYNGGPADDGLMDGARDAMDDAGRSVRKAVNDAGDAVDRAF